MPNQENKRSPASKIRNLRNKFHCQEDLDNGLYLQYGRTSGIKEGVKKIMELLKLPNISSITTKLNGSGGIDIIKLDFKRSTNRDKITHSNRPR
ncbi:hypothetical protein [Burkholderia vietnamiensis]|uniref:hypothetical protein n=1 Tax=Burkholderia vietnamiensis TaxID=60552 RepID=UPI00158AF865|nr:hypothetical protein [Burkholderia vietnamiensis]